MEQQPGRMLGQGNTAEIFEYGPGRVLKLYRAGLDEPLCRGEFERTALVSSALSCAPRAFEFITYGERFGAVLARVDGPSLLKVILAKPWTMRSAARRLAAVHRSIHQPASLPLPKLGRQLAQSIEAAEGLTQPEREQLLRLLATLPEETVLCHLDFHPDNILMSPDGPVVIDWMRAAVGNPLADVARTCLLLRFAEPLTGRGLMQRLLHPFQNSLCRIYRNEYFRLAGLEPISLRNWETIIAAARLVEWLSPHERERLLRFIRRRLGA